MKTTLLLLFSICFNAKVMHAQTNFNNYKPLQSKGEMPDDFKLAAKTKITQSEQDLGNLNKKDQNEFLENIHYGIDRLLNTGACTYGDPVSVYIKKIADNLLKNDENLRSSLRYYVVKSNAVNAFSTNQGIIFVTTGLISQFANEAQLAFVLAHEIAHYKFSHVVQSFEFSKDQKANKDIEQLSKFSKDHEFEADREAVKMCHNAGYSQEEIYGSFDVLMFSHLPFDEIEMDKKYFNTSSFYVPETIFSKKEYKINMDEDYDDEKSSHPNIQKRRDTVGYHINKYNDWKNNNQIFEAKEFYDIRNICRFETIRERIVSGDIGYALYEIYVMEKQFPESVSLQGLKAHAYYDLARRRVDFNYNDLFPSEKNLEGQSANFLQYLSKLKKDQTYTLSFRIIYDIHSKYPENEYIENAYNKILSLVSSNNRLKPSKFMDLTYLDAEKKHNEQKAAAPVEEVVEEEKKEDTGNKYSRIRQSSNRGTNGKIISGIDTLNYHLYGMTDIFANESIRSKFSNSDSNEDEDEEQGTNDTSTKKARKKARRSDNINVTGTIAAGEKLIIANPLIMSKKSNINNAKHEAEITPDVIEAIDYALKATKTNYIRIGGKLDSEDYSTKTYNQNAFVFELLSQVGDLEENMLPIIPIDYDQSLLMMSQYGSKRIAYFFYGERNPYKISAGKIALFVWFPPTMLMNLLAETTSRQNGLAAIYTFDLESGYYQTSAAMPVTLKPSKIVLRSTMYNLINR